MKINQEALCEHLKKKLAPIYWVSGEETLLIDEVFEKICLRAKENSFEEKEFFFIEDSSFDFQNFQAHTENLSLFSDKKIIELFILTSKIPEKLTKEFVRYGKSFSKETLLLIRSGKLSQAQQNSAWFKALMKDGVFIPLWPYDFLRLKKWIQQRMKKLNLSCDEESLNLLARRGENNLSALSQDIEKLSILYENKKLNVQDIESFVEDDSRFQVFDLTDPLLLGQSERALKILEKLKDQGIEVVLIVWSLTQAIRDVIQGTCKFEKQKITMNQALKRRSASEWEYFLKDALLLDGAIKGGETKLVWEGLENLIVKWGSK
ncbi:MAG: DNA polymerase III, delta subunit [uncultured bacterium]|nr:MAG: DNA polymerase III, delta subunit [uncultured bacterium]OGT15091.1 MAG: DNA polymerase III subunit delta [Gammaproteobacteria bacterium RIFCSPHIGHO2_02_FULL_38_33]OGT24900.1 MAG: DNA polymerase III subunit delta [Gammaproteobacteria bacterium RIFCSPHIGHO2_12_38_15]OGT69491.1 MAG: DNA polymerase III subunit delta [Gammaproteobacteria bacterium RIFCSPLOWO2_02_FULL_38_11]OGT76923.1 MAG: DNA polymerase III subunit delta [Gammaproteobacteria bacterium RIFCSPLOWO2_12_FULL_38_14]